MKAALPSGRGGFALVMVVFLLFAVAVAGVTGYQVVSSEFALANQSREGQEALVVARAGLQRFLGEQIGQVGDSVSYAIGNGVAAVTARKVMEQDSLNHLYFIRAVGQVADARTPLLPATRAVGAYAWHRLNPIPLRAAVLLTGGQFRLYFSGTTVDGADQATTGDCSGGGTAGTAGIGTAGSIQTYVGASYSGNPNADTHYSNYSQVYDTVGIRWDILTDPSFPVDFDGSWPDFDELPADSFPIVRYNGNLTVWGNSYSGRGVLIVTGQLVMVYDFEWDGIILAGQFNYTTGNTGNYPEVRGMLIGGMNASNPTSYHVAGRLLYHSCNAYKANRALSYLEVVDNTLFEING